MKKWILFLILIFAAGYASCKITPVFAANKEDSAAVKKVVENYFKGIANNDLDLIISCISNQYSGKDKNDKAIGYTEFKSNLEARIKKTEKGVISGLKITILNIENDKAELKAEANFKGFNPKTNVEEKRRQFFVLAKETNSWKIVKMWKEKK